MNYLWEIKIWNKFYNKLRTGLQLVAVRSRRGPRLVADRSPTSRRPIADQSPTSFNDSHAPILTKLVGDRSATSRRLIGDWSATSPGPFCDQISRSQVFVQAQKPGCDWFGRNEVPDQSPTSLQPRRDRSGTLLRPLRSTKIFSRGEVAERSHCMSDWGLSKRQRQTYSTAIGTLRCCFDVPFMFIYANAIPASNDCLTAAKAKYCSAKS